MSTQKGGYEPAASLGRRENAAVRGAIFAKARTIRNTGEAGLIHDAQLVVQALA